MAKVAVGYLGLVVVLSVATFLVYGIDKYQARVDGWRTPERLLHRLSLWGGWPGAFFGQRFFRHKTRKTEFQIIFWTIGAMHLGLVIAAIWIWWS